MNKDIYLLQTRLHPNLKISHALSKIDGIGRNRSLELCTTFGLSGKEKLSELSPECLERISTYIEQNYVVSKRFLRQNRERLIQLTKYLTYRSSRLRFGLPVRGQRNKNKKRRYVISNKGGVLALGHVNQKTESQMKQQNKLKRKKTLIIR